MTISLRFRRAAMRESCFFDDIDGLTEALPMMMLCLGPSRIGAAISPGTGANTGICPRYFSISQVSALAGPALPTRCRATGR